MKRTILGILLMICLLTGLAQPALATAESTEPTATPEVAQTRTTDSVRTYTTSTEGIAFINEMMSGNYGGSAQLAGAESSVNAFIGKYSLSLSQQQFDALVDLVMAYGETILTSDYRCEKLISAGGYTDAELASAFCAWVKSSNGFSEQLLARRLRELKLFLYGSYDGNCSAHFRYIVFHANGGTLDDNTVICYGTDGVYGTLPTASREGKTFVGWFTAATGGTQVLETDAVTQNQTVYAQWSDPTAPTEASTEATEAESTEPEPEEETVSFVDVPESAWFCKPVTRAVSLELFKGMSATEFMPNEPTTRAMIVTVLYRLRCLSGTPATTANAPFTDMEAGRWYVSAINWAYEEKIVNGITETYFGVEENVTREQLTTMIFRYANVMELNTSARQELSAFSDAGSVMNYAKDAMCWAVAVGIVAGDNGRLYPQNNATRAECAKMIVAFLDWLDEATAAPDEPSDSTTPTEPEKPAAPTLKTSEAGIQFIKDHEGFLKYAVWDYSQYSIGYGTRCEKDEFPNGITEEEADYRLRFMLADFEKVVDDLLAGSSITHTQAQYDAIISFTFNLGQQWMYSSYTVYQYIMYGGCTELQFVNTMGAWINAGGEALDGLAKRRIDEANLYLNGEYAVGSRKYQRVVFYTNGGSFGSKSDGTPITSDYFYYKSADPFGWLPSAPTREGYRFLGWFDKPSGGTLFTEASYPSTAVSRLFAHWEEIPPETTAETEPTEQSEPTEASSVADGMPTEPTGTTTDAAITATE